MSKIGIGIVTYQRLDHLRRVVEAVRRHTTSDYELVVAEDGGTDGTREWCAENGIRVVTGANGGVCWNKNRALFALQELGCDPILLLEDDCLPIEDGWDWQWRVATALFGHLAFAHPKIDPWLLGGAGTATDPYINYKATAQCSSVSGIALAEVGFFDSRFKGYGVGHAEWTTRIKRLGYGYKDAIDQLGREVKANLYIKGGLVGDDAPTFKDKANIARNQKLFEELKKEGNFRRPWADEDERQRFTAELAASGIGTSRYDPLTASAGETIGLRARHLRPYGRAFTRAFDEPKGFLRRSDWLSSIALDMPVMGAEIVPPYAYPVVDLLRDRLRKRWRVFEFGAGYSTIWWSNQIAAVRAVASDAGWAGVVASLCKPGAATVETQAVDAGYVDAVAQGGPFDVVTVQGEEREACAARAVQHLSPAGIILLPASEQGPAAAARKLIAGLGYRELPLRGCTPTASRVETTSIFYRAENVLGL